MNKFIMLKNNYVCDKILKPSNFYFYICLLLLTACIQSTKEKEETKVPPNIMLIMVDDMGYSDLTYFGGEINTPNIDQLAGEGVAISDFYVSPLCAPTRSMLLTGVDNHLNGLGIMPPIHSPNQYLQPGYEGRLNNRVATIAELLKDNGYHTYMSGKWHLGHHLPNYPANRGFERSFSMLSGGAGHFNNPYPLGPMEGPVTFYVRDTQVVEKLPTDFYSSKNFTEEIIQYLGEQKDEQPFFGYLAYTAPHDPLHIPDTYPNNYKGVYDQGYEPIKQERLKRMKAMGLVAKETPYNAGTGNFAKWDYLSSYPTMELILCQLLFILKGRAIGKRISIMNSAILGNLLLLFLRTELGRKRVIPPFRILKLQLEKVASGLL